MSDSGLNNGGWNNSALNSNNRILDPSNQINHLNSDLIANNLTNITNLNPINNTSLYSSAVDSNDSNDEDSRDSLRGSNSEINLNGDANDAEGVWSPDIEQSFQEALAIYPPCGRRKIILSEEGKMYGRNELIARYIKLRTGKTRTRKQVSSHIQVLARRKAREHNTKGGAKPFWPNNASNEDIKPLAGLNNNNLSFQYTNNSNGNLNNSNVIGTNLQSSNNHSNNNSSVTDALNNNSNNGSNTIAALSHHHHNNHHNINNINNNLTNSHIFSHLGSGNSDNGILQPIKTIASSTLRLLNFVAYLEFNNLPISEQAHSSDQLSLTLNDSTNSENLIDLTHIFVEIKGESIVLSNQNASEYNNFEDIKLELICDKFPQNKDGLKELYDKGPQDAFFLVKCWADLNVSSSVLNDSLSFFGTNAVFESRESMIIVCTTIVCSFGKKVVEKVEKEIPSYENGRYIYRIERSQMCTYMVNFINKLKTLPEEYMMNSVLENFTILQIITSQEKTLLCIAFAFEVSTSDHGAQYQIFRLTSSENVLNMKNN